MSVLSGRSHRLAVGSNSIRIRLKLVNRTHQKDHTCVLVASISPVLGVMFQVSIRIFQSSPCRTNLSPARGDMLFVALPDSIIHGPTTLRYRLCGAYNVPWDASEAEAKVHVKRGGSWNVNGVPTEFSLNRSEISETILRPLPKPKIPPQRNGRLKAARYPWSNNRAVG